MEGRKETGAVQTVADIRKRLRDADEETFRSLKRSLQADTRKGVQQALAATQRRLDAERAERQRVLEMYAFQSELAAGRTAVGLDEVGRGPLAGPLTVGAVVLNPDAQPIWGINDSKQVTPRKREELSRAIKQRARAWTTVSVEPARIDAEGISACLRWAFSQAVAQIEAQGVNVEVILLDGNPLGLDAREVNVVKGDARCASIACASLIAKVERDAYMVECDALYPGYDFAASKGYGSARHCDAIRQQGLTPLHRATFCQGLLQVQQSLF